ncbi:hypothetical protein H6P81_020741 [Aristolochia fimbriata]|uniref:Secreted protein n=1 Tax=Aristolochia fimbriata TaxID=158543 RepID=A0AAV7DYH7_ARIFI|nr:hypothetical protein H6P81_020741 [Aristolochia fimbriata]
MATTGQNSLLGLNKLWVLAIVKESASHLLLLIAHGSPDSFRCCKHNSSFWNPEQVQLVCALLLWWPRCSRGFSCRGDDDLQTSAVSATRVLPGTPLVRTGGEAGTSNGDGRGVSLGLGGFQEHSNEVPFPCPGSEAWRETKPLTTTFTPPPLGRF